MSSGGLYSATSGLPSPTSVTSGAAGRRGGPSSIIPLGNTSPLSASPSTSSARRESSTSHMFLSFGQGRPSAERQSQRSSGSDQTYSRMVPPESRESRAPRGLASGPFFEPAMSRGPRSPLESPRRSTRVSSQLQYNASDSSKSSIASLLSNGSTAASSISAPATFNGEKRPGLSLPPLATLGPHSSGKELAPYGEPAARPTLQPLASRTASSIVMDQSSPSPFNSSSSTGMKFESLQLPLPYNISFGQRPLPRPGRDGKLADKFNDQDVSREGASLRDLSLDQEQGGATPTISRSPPEPRHPPHHPNLPSLPSLLRDDTHDSFPHNADPLSVLAYAGRIVGREREIPRPS